MGSLGILYCTSYDRQEEGEPCLGADWTSVLGVSRLGLDWIGLLESDVKLWERG